MALARTLNLSLLELRRLGSARYRRARTFEVAHLITRLLAASRTVAIEERPGGTAFRLQSVESRAGDDDPAFMLTCVLHGERAQIGRASCRERV